MKSKHYRIKWDMAQSKIVRCDCRWWRESLNCFQSFGEARDALANYFRGVKDKFQHALEGIYTIEESDIKEEV